MKRLILLLSLIFFTVPIYAGYGSGDRIGADNPATEDLDMNGYNINDIGDIDVTGNMEIDGHSIFESSVTISSHVVVQGDVTITGTVLSTATYAQNADKLDGNDSTYFAIKTDVATATGTLTTSITNLETSTSTLEGYITALWTSTSTLEGNLNTEISNRISEDNLISDATVQLRSDVTSSTNTLRTDVTNLETSTSTLEGYISALWTSTATLETATALNTTHRSSDGSDHSFIDQDVTISATPTFSSMTVIYGMNGGSLTINGIVWDDGNGKIDGEQIAANTIDEDSIDFGTGAGQISLSSFTNDLVLTSSYVFVGSAAGIATGVAISGDITITDDGVVTVIDDSHAHIITDIDSFSEAELETQTSDVTNLIQEGEIDTVAELDAIASDYNILTSTEIDTFAELDAIVSDKSLVNKEDANIFTANMTLDNTGSSVNSPILYLKGDDGGIEEEIAFQLMQGADPYFRISVSSNNTSSSLKAVIDIHDTVIAFAYDGVCDIGADGANRPKDIHMSGSLEIANVVWDNGSGKIDGEQIANDTIDYDSIDWGDGAGQVQDISSSGTPTFSSSTITTDLSVNGTFYYNASYAHGYATDVVVAVTGSTETFIILDATWNSTVASNGFTISGASCTYNGNGGTPKIFKVSGAFSAISGAANTVVYWALFKNGVLYESAIINRKIAVAADVGAMSLSTLIELSTGDILDIRLSGDNNTNITNKFVQFDIIQIN